MKATCRNERGVHAFSRYFLDHGKAWDWFPCLVTGYDAKTKLFAIEWVPSGITKHVSRLNVVFEEESKEMFYQRIEHAVKARNAYEKEQRYRNMIMDHNMTAIAPLPENIKLGMIERIGYPIMLNNIHVVVSFNFCVLFEIY